MAKHAFVTWVECTEPWEHEHGVIGQIPGNVVPGSKLSELHLLSLTFPVCMTMP